MHGRAHRTRHIYERNCNSYNVISLALRHREAAAAAGWDQCQAPMDEEDGAHCFFGLCLVWVVESALVEVVHFGQRLEGIAYRGRDFWGTSRSWDHANFAMDATHARICTFVLLLFAA